ncbi:MAG: hypothetical protein L0Y32_01505, partial [Nevskiales bacterium]|nr:hypothetical protein [Nevskiales bacterium]
LWIIDYKTHLQPHAAALQETYREQLARYADLVRGAWPGRPVIAGLILTATREWVPVVPEAV